MLALWEKLLFEIENEPGRTESDLSRAIFGPDGCQQRVNQECRLLMNAGKVERRGAGGPAEPFTYHIPRGKGAVGGRQAATVGILTGTEK